MHISVQWLVEPRCEHWETHRQTESLWSCLLFKASWSFSIQDRWPNSDQPPQGVNIKCIGTKTQIVPSVSLYLSRGRSLCASVVCLCSVQSACWYAPLKTRKNAHFLFFNHTSMTVRCVTCTVFSIHSSAENGSNTTASSLTQLQWICIYFQRLCASFFIFNIIREGSSAAEHRGNRAGAKLGKTEKKLSLSFKETCDSNQKRRCCRFFRIQTLLEQPTK